MSAFPDDLDINNKRESTDWFAIFNPKVKKVLDVQLVHSLMHERCVCVCPVLSEEYV